MMDRTRERERERDTYEDIMAAYKQRKENVRKGRVVLRGDEIPVRQGRQGYSQHFSNPANWSELASPGWNSFVQNISVQTGKHVHQGGTSLFVLEGAGYTVVDGRRFDWQAGDLIMLPIQPGGCEHQHFNTSTDGTSKWLSLINRWAKEPLANDIRQREDHPDYRGSATQVDDPEPEPTVFDVDTLTRIEPARRGGTLLDALLDQRDDERQRLKSARMVIKGDALEREVNLMGIFRWYTHPHMRDVGHQVTTVYLQEIPPGSRSGKQLHQGGRLHYVWEGRGHTVIDGVRHDWKEGDMVLLPHRWEGTVHQHFNDSDRHPVQLVCAEGNFQGLLGVDMGSGLAILEACPEYENAERP